MSIRKMIIFALLGIGTVILTVTITGSAASGASEEYGGSEGVRSEDLRSETSEEEIKEDESQIDMIAARSVVKDLIVGLMEIVLNSMVKDLQSLNLVSSFLINDFMFEEFQKKLVNFGPRKCDTFRDLIDWYYSAFQEHLRACGLNTTDHPRAIARNTPMRAHLQNLQNSCGIHNPSAILIRGSKTLRDLFDMDKGASSDLNERAFPLGQAKKDVLYTLGRIMELVLINNCHDLRSLRVTSYYFISHHTNLFSYMQQVAKETNAFIGLIEGYQTKFWKILNAAQITGEKIPMLDELNDLKNYYTTFHGFITPRELIAADEVEEDEEDEEEESSSSPYSRDPEPERVTRREEGTSSSRSLRRAFSRMKIFGKSRTFD